MLRQKARVRWDVEGDENTKFFHSFVKRRNNKNNIRGLLVDRVWCEEPNSIKKEMVRHYKTLFSEGERICCDRIIKISCEEVNRVESDFDEKEVWQEIGGCGGDKAPGPDGFNFKFIRKFWDIIKADIVRAVKWFGDRMEISRGCNASFVTIIPKVADPIGLGDFRPISLIGCYYKIISKMLAERVKKVVGNVVGDVQNAFIKGRYILDGILVANETVEFIKRKDLSKIVYDVNFGKWIANGRIRIRAGRVRQGDPLSPFLFILAVEGLNAIVSEAVDKGIFNGIVVGSDRVTVSHLQYVVDTIFFGEWNKENAKSLMCILKCFEEVSDLRVNFNKSKLYGVGVTGGEIVEMARWMSCGVGELPITYLGLSIGVCMRRTCAWNPVVEKFKKWLADWKAKTMSFGGRLTLVKAVLGSLPLYYFSMFHVPSSVIKNLRVFRVVGNGNDIRFWVDKWVGGVRLCDKFPRLYHLDSSKECKVAEKGKWVDNGLCWEWVWVRNLRGRVCKDFEELQELLHNVVIKFDCRDMGEKRQFETNGFQKSTFSCGGALKGRLPVREELDKRGIDLESLLCPSCGDMWKIGVVNAFSIEEFFSSNGNANVPRHSYRIWQAVIWTSGHFIWKERNTRVFKGKASSLNKIVQGPSRIFSNVGIGSDRLVPCVTAVMVSASAGSHCCYLGPGTSELGMAELKKWSKDRFGSSKEKIEEYRKEAMMWELEAENRSLNEEEMSIWMEARQLWVEKKKKRLVCLGKRLGSDGM
ncbi:putative RNA-directed DNA polymerase [Tanacetum coccineum]